MIGPLPLPAPSRGRGRARPAARGAIGALVLGAALACDLPVSPSPDARVPADGAPAARAPYQGEGARWSDRATWPDSVVPVAGADVAIPAGTRVLLDVSPPALGVLAIKGELAFADGDLELSAHAVFVSGALRVGAAELPFRHHATITLTGRPGDADNQTGKGLWVLPGGSLELHGEPRSTWTRLAATAERGATSLSLQGAADWRAGDTLVVAPSGYWQAEVETRVVRSVSGTTVALDAPLAFQHWGQLLTVAGRAVDQRAEVGLINRNVVVQGDSSSEATGYGGHILVLAGGVAHVDAVELYRMGQRGRIARYPFHWHMAGHVPGQSITRSSVWRSFNRCVTVHGSHEALVADNVCYDHTGHGYFIEDGIETGNTLRGNLGVFSRRGTTIESDGSPSTFWVTNPDNTIVDNAAAGSAGAGIWYAPPRHPTGPSATSAVQPFMLPLRKFDGNVAHSNGGDGVRVEGVHSMHDPDGGFEVDYRPRDPGTGRPVTATFSRLTTYMNAEQGFWSRGDHHAVVGLVAAGNRIGVKIGDAEIASHSIVRDALVIGETALRSPVPSSAPHFGTHLYDGPVRLENVTFANYPASGGTPGAAIGPEWGFDGRIAAGNGGTGLRFVNSNAFLYRPAPEPDGERQAIYRDEDGSATGIAGSTIVPENPMLLDASCSPRGDWHAHVCRSPMASLWIQGWDTPAGRYVAPATVTRDDGLAMRYTGYQPHTLALTLLTGRTYTVRPETPTPGIGFNFAWDALGAGQAFHVVLPWDLASATTSATARSGRAVSVGASCATALASTATAVAFEPETKRLCVTIVGEAGVPNDELNVHP
jgi:cell migration-inducing and hyaluronan-binding protein